jgi:DNA polymerase-3 subunit gamma/tau
MDAASNRGIDDIRELKENVHTLPFNGKYKVYIIDEVHMLTKEAFNSLLKTLEEPPAHVIFILATTELHKVPDTIVSRCQNFKFNKPTDAILADVVMNITEKEGSHIDADAASIIAMLGDGSFRDTLVTLQKVLSYAKSKKITIKDVEDITGAPERTLVHGFIDALLERDANDGFKVIEAISKEGIEVRLFLKMVLHTMRMALLIRYAPDMRKGIEASVSEIEYKYLEKIMNEKGGMLSSTTLGILLDCYQTLGQSFIRELPLELAFLKAIQK